MTNYTYDARDQLTAADHAAQPDEAYSYDANGNRTTAGYATSADNRLQSDGVYNYTYDTRRQPHPADEDFRRLGDRLHLGLPQPADERHRAGHGGRGDEEHRLRL